MQNKMAPKWPLLRKPVPRADIDDQGGMERPPAKLLSAVLRNFANGGKFFVLYTGSKDWHCRDGLFNLGMCLIRI